MARVSLDPPRTLSYRLASWFSRRRYQDMLDPVTVMARAVPAGRADGVFEMPGDRRRPLDHRLKDLAVMAVAGKIACSRCTDLGFWGVATRQQMPAEQIRAIPEWWDSDLFTALERLVLGYAEAMTATPPAVPDELVAQLSEQLSAGQLAELTAIIAVQNLHSRITAALGPPGVGPVQGVTGSREIAAARP